MFSIKINDWQRWSNETQWVNLTQIVVSSIMLSSCNFVIVISPIRYRYVRVYLIARFDRLEPYEKILRNARSLTLPQKHWFRLSLFQGYRWTIANSELNVQKIVKMELFLHFNLCLCVKLGSASCSFTSISFLLINKTYRLYYLASTNNVEQVSMVSVSILTLP